VDKPNSLINTPANLATFGNDIEGGVKEDTVTTLNLFILEL
jgi:hypothetical protein